MYSLRSVALTAMFACAAAAQNSTITTFAGNPLAGPGFSGDTSLATAAQLNNPSGVAIDSVGNVYIADSANSRVREVNTSGVITTFAGTGVSGYTGDNGEATSATLMDPVGVAVDSLGNVYIADGTAAVIRKVTNGIITTIAGTGKGGFSGDGGSATSAALNLPSSIAVDASGNLYIADAGNHRIRKISTGLITTIAGNGNFGFAGDGAAATSASLYFPQGVAVDSSGNVYIADTQNNRIRKVAGGIITTVAGNGTPAYSGDKGSALAASLNGPRSVAVDTLGNFYIGDTGNNTVRKVSESTIVTVAGTGIPGYSGDGGAAGAAELNAPVGLALDSTGGYTYIGDTGNSLIRLITNTNISGVIPHFAAGGSYVTAMYVVNKSASAQTFSMSFYDDTGTQISVPVTGGTTTGTTLTDTIPAFGVGYYEAGVLSATGAILSGSVQILSSPSLIAEAVFRHQGAATSPYEAAVPATLGSYEAEVVFDATTYAPTGSQIYTGFAVANLDGSNIANVACVARDNGGNVITGAVAVPALNPDGHYAAYQFPALTGLRGTLDCKSNTKIAMIGLRALGDAISTLPVILK